MGALLALEVCVPQLASPVGAAPGVVPVPPPLVPPPPPPTAASGSVIGTELPDVPPPGELPGSPTVPGEPHPAKAMLVSKEAINRMNRSAEIACFMIASRGFVTTVVNLDECRIGQLFLIVPQKSDIRRRKSTRECDSGIRVSAYPRIHVSGSRRARDHAPQDVSPKLVFKAGVQKGDGPPGLSVLCVLR